MVELVMRVSLLLLLAVLTASAKSINPAVKRIVDAVSEERIAAIEKKLESFETRNIYSDTDNPKGGIGAARRWIFEQFQRYSPRLQVSFDSSKVKKQKRVFREPEVVNVVAVLPGSINGERMVMRAWYRLYVDTPRPKRVIEVPKFMEVLSKCAT
jgi:hypothetical protein